MVEATSPTAGVGTRRDYALNRRLSVGIDLERATSANNDCGDDRRIHGCATVITTFPFLCPCSTYLKASAIRSRG
jgi:hypothetical protein